MKSNFGFVLGLSIIAFLGITSWQSNLEYNSAVSDRVKIRQIMFAIKDVSSSIKDAETGQRGFLLTARDAYLVPYEAAQKSVPSTLGDLKALLQRDTEASRKVEKLEIATRAKLSELAETVTLRRTRGFEAALSVVKSDRGQDLMNQIRQTLNELLSDAEARADKINRQIDRVQNRNNYLVPTGNLLAFLLVAFALYFASRHNAIRAAAEEEVRYLNGDLERRVFEATEKLRHTVSELETKSGLLETVLEQMPTAVIVARAPDGELMLENKQVAEIWRHPMHLSKSINEYGEWKGFHPDGRPYAPTDWPLARALMTGKVIPAEDTDVLRGDGTRGVLRLYAAPVKNKSGEMIAAVVICEDVTDRKRMELAEKERGRILAREHAALEATRLKSEFLANMSHEIRTPMNAIIGMAELLADTTLDSDQTKYVQTFKRAGDNLLSLINDILDFSKIEAGDLTIDHTEFDLAEVVENATDLMAPRAHAKGIELAVLVKSDVPNGLIGDPNRLRQILVNLIGNSVKFTEKGEVVVSVDLDVSKTNQTALRFTVADTGIGIPSDKINDLFQRFSQVDTSVTRKYGGTGLGLSISKQLVELMGGEITVASQEGQGSQFTFIISFDMQAKPYVKKNYELELQNVRTLIVDDNSTNRMILSEALQSWGARTHELDSGRDVIRVLETAVAENDPYGVVLLDFRMPGMDGCEVADAIRRTTGNENVVMMLLTSDNRGAIGARSKELGIKSLLVKPLKRSELGEALSVAMGHEKKSSKLAPLTCDYNGPSGQRILLVDDSEDNRSLIVAHMKRTSYTVDVAENGQIAVDKFKSGSYDLVLMDMQMPVLDGYSATREIRAWEATQSRTPTPIVALTAYALKQEAQKSYDAGCDAHLTKPIKKATLFAAVEEFLSRRKAA